MKTVIKPGLSEKRDPMLIEGKDLFVLLTTVTVAFIWILSPIYGAIMCGVMGRYAGTHARPARRGGP